MAAFLQTYGIWIALAGVMLLMHRFGFGCCGSHGHGADQQQKEDPKPPESKAIAGGKPEPTAATPPARGGGCH